LRNAPPGALDDRSSCILPARPLPLRSAWLGVSH
jgi:hypothetical protein